MPVWTLWLITLGSIISNGGATPVVTALATYPSERDCLVSLETIGVQISKEYGAKNTPSPGLMFCV
jgi:hypothetical protein